MNKKFIIAVAVLLFGVVAWSLYYFSDKQVIKRKFAAVAVSLSKDGDETPVMIALKMKPVKDFVATACEVTVPERNYHEVLWPDLVTRYLIMYRSRQVDLQVAFDEILVDIPTDGRAEVSALVHVIANRNQPDFFDEIHRVKFFLQKQEKSWLLHKAILPDALVRR
ncbi:MAG: hypothetical protein OEV89_11125 [Desulfobulbaceae bacterium]|nr:hypothetical protein [Desulfobulbaceae bacterium]HIJ91240.1 hypothetical protein [Deltaproteobacteria bacterium]